MKNEIKEKKDNKLMGLFWGNPFYENADEEIRKDIINLVLNLKWEVSDEEN